MLDNPSVIQALWEAFPKGYAEIPGIRTLGGYYVLRGKGGLLWFQPVGGGIISVGSDTFDEVRDRLELLPDPMDPNTWTLLRHYLADRAGMDTTQGIGWFPKSKQAVDTKRASTGKVLAGWSLKSFSRNVTLPIDEKNGVIALLKAIQMTNCTCGVTGMRLCPLHGDSKAKPWR